MEIKMSGTKFVERYDRSARLVVHKCALFILTKLLVDWGKRTYIHGDWNPLPGNTVSEKGLHHKEHDFHRSFQLLKYGAD